MVYKERVTYVPPPDCDPKPLVWDDAFEAFNKPASELIKEFDARGDALVYAGGALWCYRSWADDMRNRKPE